MHLSSAPCKSYWQDRIRATYKRNYMSNGGLNYQFNPNYLRAKMAFCYQNCSYLLQEENDQGKAWKIEAEVREFSKNLRSLEQFIQTVKGRNNF